MDTEKKIQEECAKFLDNLETLTRKFTWFHVPNEGKRSKTYAAALKRAGLKPGVPDIVILFKGGRTRWVELKTAKGIISPSQADWHEKLLRLGFTIDLVKEPRYQDAVERLAEIMKEEGVLI